MINNYQVYFSELAKADIENIVSYISHELYNPTSAKQLKECFRNEIESIRQFPYANAEYEPIKPMRYTYRKAIVKNYLIFYQVDTPNKTIIITRILYQKRDLNTLILS